MKKLWIMLSALVAIAALAVLFMVVMDDEEPTNTLNTNPLTNATNTQNATPAANTADENDDEEENASVTITYTDSGFQPSSYTVKAGDTVTIVNNSSELLDFASNEHPDHTDNSELNVGEIAAGSSRTFVPQTTGDWGFHNHERDEHEGSLTVQ